MSFSPEEKTKILKFCEDGTITLALVNERLEQGVKNFAENKEEHKEFKETSQKLKIHRRGHTLVMKIMGIGGGIITLVAILWEAFFK